jgi:F-type H+-transporting ATPase subunit a
MKDKYKILKFSLLILLFFTVASSQLSAAPEEGGSKTGWIMHHIKDAHEWHFATIGHTHITLPLPVIIYEVGYGLRTYMSSAFYDEHHNAVTVDGYYIDDHEHIQSVNENVSFYDISITKNVAALLLSVVILLLVFITVANRYKKHPGSAPRGMQSFLEPIIIFVRDEIARPTIGDKKYGRFMPYLLTVFFFIWLNNLLGLIPGSANLTGNIAVTLTLAVFTFLITTFSGTKDYWKHIFNTPGVPWWLKFPIPIMPVVEFIGMFTKPFSLMVRLFANITAGHIIIYSLIALVFIFETAAVGIASVIFGVFMNVIELLVAFIQAFVFTLLSAIYFGMAVEEHDSHEEALEHQAI